MDNQANKEQHLGLKVMRLLKPSLNSSLPIYDQETNTPTRYLFQEIFSINNGHKIKSDMSFSHSDFLVLPQSFGNIFIGEVFSSYLCIHNHSDVTIRRMSVQIELQTKSSKVGVPLKSKYGQNVDFLGPDQMFDGIIHHAIKDHGIHVLVCNVTYLTDKNEEMNFKKFFKFSVSKPFEIQAKFANLKDDACVLFEASIENEAGNVLFIENVTLDDVEKYDVECLNSNKIKILKPNEIRQYVFKITSTNGMSVNKSKIDGKLLIKWRNPYSDVGELATNSIFQTDSIGIKRKDLIISLNDIKEFGQVGHLLNIELKLKNISERSLDLSVQLKNDDKYGYFWNCIMNHCDLKLSPNQVFLIQMAIVPFKSGFLNINGIQVTDVFLKRVYEESNLASIFVLDNEHGNQ